MQILELPQPDQMSALERAIEITAILATATVRSQIGDAQNKNNFKLGFPPKERVHTTPYQTEKLS